MPLGLVTLTLPGLNDAALLLGHLGNQILLWSQSSQTWAVELLFILHRKVMKILQNPIPCLRGRRKQATNGRRWDNGCADLDFAVIDGKAVTGAASAWRHKLPRLREAGRDWVALISYQILEESISWGEKLFSRGIQRMDRKLSKPKTNCGHMNSYRNKKPSLYLYFFAFI